jgi:excisionase family DNA binding protein
MTQELLKMFASTSDRSRRLGDALAAMIEAHLREPAPPDPESREAAPPDPEPLAYTIAQALRLLSIGRSTFYREVWEGRLRVIHVRGRTLVRAEELRRYLDQAEAA